MYLRHVISASARMRTRTKNSLGFGPGSNKEESALQGAELEPGQTETRAPDTLPSHSAPTGVRGEGGTAAVVYAGVVQDQWIGLKKRRGRRKEGRGRERKFRG